MTECARRMGLMMGVGEEDEVTSAKALAGIVASPGQVTVTCRVLWAGLQFSEATTPLRHDSWVLLLQSIEMGLAAPRLPAWP